MDLYFFLTISFEFLLSKMRKNIINITTFKLRNFGKKSLLRIHDIPSFVIILDLNLLKFEHIDKNWYTKCMFNPFTSGAYWWSDTYWLIFLREQYFEKKLSDICQSRLLEQSFFKYLSNLTLLNEIWSKLSDHVCTPDAKGLRHHILGNIQKRKDVFRLCASLVEDL